MNKLSQRALYFIGFLITVLLLGVIFYLENYNGFVPCPLCILQRFVLILLGGICFLGFLLSLKKMGRIVFGFLTSLTALTGVLLSGRQVWLQHLPLDKNADCGVSLQYLLNALPFDQVVMKILHGTAECSQRGWELFGLSLAEWSLFCFTGFMLFGLLQMRRA